MNKKKNDVIRPEFTLLITGSANNDFAAERIAAGNICVVHHKLAYTVPYAKFEELRKFQLKVRHSPCSVGKKICAAIDISEWIGHENEEFFIASVKYFHDHCDRMSFVFTVGECDLAKVQAMYLKLRMYMRGTVKVDETFLKADALAAYIVSEQAETDAAALLAQVLMTPQMKPLRTYPAVDSICSDIRDMSGSDRIEITDVTDYLMSENSLMYLIRKDVSLRYAGKAAEKSRNKGSHSAA